MPFGITSGVGRVMGVLDGGPCASKGRGVATCSSKMILGRTCYNMLVANNN